MAGAARYVETAILAVVGAVSLLFGIAVGAIVWISSQVASSTSPVVWAIPGLLVAGGLWLLGMAMFRRDRKPGGSEEVGESGSPAPRR